MDGQEPDTPGGRPKGRGVDAVVWLVIIVVMIGVAGGVAWLLSNPKFKLPEIRFTDATEDVNLIQPVPPPVAQPPVDAPPAPQPEPPPTVGPNGEVMKVPIWVRPPSPEYPGRAMGRGIESGVVVLRCEAMASGELGACEVMDERPVGVGFAEAALRGARGARVRPRSLDGFETDSTIQYTVRFRLEK